MANKKQWDKTVHASVTFDTRVTQEDWKKLSPHVPAAADAPSETRMYNPSGPHYGLTEAAPAAELKKE